MSEASAEELPVCGPAKRARAGYIAVKRISRYWAEIVIVTLALILWAPRLSGPIDLRWDGGVYYLLGTSLATGQGYRILSEPGSPQAIQYPPLLPAFVALHERFLGTTDPSIVAPWLRKSYAVMFVLLGVSLFALARRALSAGFALIAVGLCLCQVMTVFMSDLLFTELPFALLSVLFVLVATRQTPTSHPWLRESLIFFLAAAGFLLRTAGVALLGAWVIDALIRAHWRLALVRLALAMIPIVAWQAYIANVRGSREYEHPAYEYQRAPYQYSNVSYADNAALVDPFRPELGRLDAGALARRLTSNVRSMILALGQAVSVREGEWERLLAKVQHKLIGRSAAPRKELASIAIYPLAAIVVFGLVVLFRRGAWVITLTVFLSLGLIWTTPWPVQFNRYLMPLSPFLAISAVLALSEIDTVLRRYCTGGAGRLVQLLVPSVLVLMLALESFATLRLFRQRASPEGVATGASITGSYRLFAYSRAWQDWERAANWIEIHGPAGAIVATMPSHFFYLLTGRPSILPPMDLDRSRVCQLLGAVPVSYVIVDQIEFPDLSRRYALPAVESNPEEWRLVDAVKGTRIYERTSAVE